MPAPATQGQNLVVQQTQSQNQSQTPAPAAVVTPAATVQTFTPPTVVVQPITRTVVIGRTPTRQVFTPPTTRVTTLPFTGGKALDGILLGIAAIAGGFLLKLALPPALVRARRLR